MISEVNEPEVEVDSEIFVVEEAIWVPQEDSRGKTEQRASKKLKILLVDFIEKFPS